MPILHPHKNFDRFTHRHINRYIFKCFCRICSTSKRLTYHLKQCLVESNGVQAITLSLPGSTLKVKNNGKQFRALFVIHAQIFKFTLEKTDDVNRPQQHKPRGHIFTSIGKAIHYELTYNWQYTTTRLPFCVAL